MLKITRVETPVIVFKLEGKLLGPWVHELQQAVSDQSRLPPTLIDLSGLSFVDRDGAALLRELRRQGIELSAGSQFVTELLNLE